MKKFVAFGFGALMALNFAACSDDDIAGQNTVDEGNTGYISVNVMGVESGTTRADEEDDAVFTNGTKTEHDISNIKFLFFDENNKFLSIGTVSKNVDLTDNTEGENVEAWGKSVVIVPNYGTNVPKKMITLANVPQGLSLSAGETMEKFIEEVTTYQNANGFVMTSSTYMADGTMKYYTDVDESNFHTTYDKAEADENPVDVYIERLAVKADVNLADLKRYDKTTGLYQLGRFTVDGKKKTFYAKFISWGLNCTAPDAYYMKHINTSWTSSTTDGLGFVWNAAGKYRSYWAEGSYYSANRINYPDYYIPGNTTLDFISQTDMTGVNNKNVKKFDGTSYAYCNENTNSANKINDHWLPGTVTHVLVLAQLCNKDGKAFTDIVKFSGSYYTRAGIVQGIINSTELKNVTTADGLQLKDYVTLVNDAFLNGHLCPQLTEEGKNLAWEDNTGAAVTADHINSFFKSYVENGTNKEIIGYKDGYMYYYAPIRHLSNVTPYATDNKNGFTYNEGYYGVVRNHWYDITIDGFGHRPFDPTDPNDPYYDPELDPNDPSYDPDKDPADPDPFEDPGDEDDPNYNPEKEPGEDTPSIDPGHGIEEPDEPIVPNPDADTDYYMGANINILAWRLVTQNVQL